MTGGKGYLGAALIGRLVQRGEKVVCVDRKTTPGRLEPVHDEITMVGGGVPGVDDLVDILRRYDIDRVAHMVFFDARPDAPEEIREEVELMTMATVNTYEAARRAGVKTVVIPSSIHVFGPQWMHGDVYLDETAPSLTETVYGTGKKFSEVVAAEYIARSGLNIVALRIPAVYGPGARVGARGVNAVAVEPALGRPVRLPYPPDEQVCVAHVEDVAEAVTAVLLSGRPAHRLYNIGGHTVSYWRLASLITCWIRDAQITFAERDVVSDLPYLIDDRRIRDEFSIAHRSLHDGYLDLVNDTRRAAGVPPVDERGEDG